MRSKYEYYCSCSKGKLKYEATNKHTKMHLTVVTGDALCIHCEHYAVVSEFRPKYDGTPFVSGDAELVRKAYLRRGAAYRAANKEYA